MYVCVYVSMLSPVTVYSQGRFVPSSVVQVLSPPVVLETLTSEVCPRIPPPTTSPRRMSALKVSRSLFACQKNMMVCYYGYVVEYVYMYFSGCNMAIVMFYVLK